MIRQHNKFVPDVRNLGGKADIDNLKNNHLLALINARPAINTHKAPHKHVNSGHRSQKKILNNYNEYKEVHEAFRRVQQLKKGGIDQKKPQTFSRQNQITKRIPQSKNIVMQDHQRNIKSLLTRLDNVEKQHEKKVEKIKYMGSQYSNSNNSRFNNISNIQNQSIRSINSTRKNSSFQNQSQQNFYNKNNNNNYSNNNYQQYSQMDTNNNDEYSKVMDFCDGQDEINDYEGEYDNQQQQDQEYQQQQNQEQYGENQNYNNQDQDEQQDYEDYTQDNFQKKQQQSKDLNYTPHTESIRDFSYYSIQQQQNQNHSKYQQQNQNKNIARNRPQSAKVAQQGDNKYNIPYIKQGQGTDPYRELRRVLLNIVMDQNLYDKNIITQELPMAVKKANPALSRVTIQEICQNICRNLYGDI